jgi:hypothetical protein
MPRIYHFTDFANLERILTAGALQCHKVAPTKVDIGNSSIKENRQNRDVPCGLRGKVCDYVPFYFAPRSPMLYSIMRGNVEGVDPDQRRLVYFVSSTEALYNAGLECVFTDGNAAVLITDFDDDPANLDTLVDWPLMKATYWYNTAEDPDRRRRRMAEFLVHDGVPLDLFTEVGVFSSGIATAIVDGLGDAFPVPFVVRRDWYF